MFTIDLLKAEGIPIRSRPSGIAFACLVILVPLLLGVLIVGTYLDRRVTLSVQADELARVEKVLGTLSEALQRKHSLEEKKATARDLLVDVNTALGREMQWSGVLATLTASMPEDLVLTRLEARREYIWRKVPSKDDPKTMIEVTVPQRSLAIDVCGIDKNKASLAVRDLQERLRASSAVGPSLSGVTVSQESSTLDGEHVVSYELHCEFRPSPE